MFCPESFVLVGKDGLNGAAALTDWQTSANWRQQLKHNNLGQNLVKNSQLWRLGFLLWVLCNDRLFTFPWQKFDFCMKSVFCCKRANGIARFEIRCIAWTNSWYLRGMKREFWTLQKIWFLDANLLYCKWTYFWENLKIVMMMLILPAYDIQIGGHTM